MTKHTNAPALRFPEFRDEWNQNKLSDVVNVYDGTHQTPKYTNEGIKFLSVENIKTLNSDKYISKEDFIKEFKIHPEYGDILMTRIGDIGTPNIVNLKEPLAYYVSLALLKPININSYFLNSLILSPTVQNELWRKTLHIAFPKKINKNEIAKVLINYPTFNEQEKIGYFFSKLDRQIELEEEKLELLEQQKRGYMQKIFSQELRFKDEIGNEYPEWKNTKLRNVIKLQNGYAFKSNLFTEKGIPIIRITDINKSLVSEGTVYYPRNINIDEKFIINKNDILIAMSGATTGKLGKYISDTSSYLNQRIGKFVMKNKTNNDFLFAYLNSIYFKKELIKLLVSGAQPNISSQDIENIELSLPDPEEQRKIGIFLSNFDEFIQKQSIKIEQLKQRKKGLLQKMFI